MPPKALYPPGLLPATVPLDFEGGLVGGPLPSTLVAPGGLAFDNLCLGAGGNSLKTMPGWRRILLNKIRVTSTYALDNTKKWVAVRGAAIGLPSTWTVVCLVDWTLAAPHARILSIGINPQLDPTLVGGGWVPASDDTFVLSEYGSQGVTLGRMTAHEYPLAPVTYRDKTILMDPYTAPITVQPGAVTQTPPRPPRKPVIWAAATRLDCDLLHATTTALTVYSSNSTVAQQSTAPNWSATAPNYNQVTVATTGADENLCYATKFFSFVDTGEIKACTVDDKVSGWGVERGRYSYRTAYYVTCYEPPTLTTGAGLDDIRVTGSSTSITNSTIEIQARNIGGGGGGADQFRFRVDAGAWSGLADMDNDYWITLTGTGLKVRWLSKTGHTLDNVWTIEAEYVGTSDAGFPTRVSKCGDPSSPSTGDSEMDLDHIPLGSNIIGVGGRKVYRTLGGPLDVVKDTTDVGTRDGGLIPMGVHKWVYSYVIPEMGETPCSLVADEATENTKYPMSAKLFNLLPCPPRCKGFESGGTAMAVQSTQNDLLLEGAWALQGDVDWEVKIVVATVGPGAGDQDTYDWYLNNVLQASGVPMSGAATGLGTTGFTVEWNDPTNSHVVGQYWIWNRAMNNITRRVYRSDGEDKYHLVGEQDHLETEFSDNVPTEELGEERPSIQDLPFYLVNTLENVTADSFTDHTRNFNMGAKLDKIPDAVNHTRVRFAFRLKDNKADPGRILAPNSIAFFASPNTTPSESVKEVPIDIAIQAGPWYYLDLPWTHGYFESNCYGFRQIQRDRDNADTSTLVFQVGQINIDRGKWGPFTGKWNARFTFADEETQCESDSSDPTIPLNLDEKPTGIELHLPGYRGFWDVSPFTNDPVGMNIPPVNNSGTTITHPDINIYLFKHSWGDDAEQGGGKHRLAVENGKNPIPVAITPAQWANYKIQIGNKDSKFLGEDDSYSIGPSTPGETSSEDKATSQTLRKRKDRKAFTAEGGILGRTREDNAGIAIQELREAVPLHDFHGRGPACWGGVLDQDRIVTLPQSDFTVGTFSPTQYKDIMKYTASGVSKLYPWMEGRKLTINSTDKEYGDGQFTTAQREFVIRQVINHTTPANCWVRFGSAYTSETQEFKEAFYGTSGTYSFKIHGDDNTARYSANTRAEGVQTRYFPAQNTIDIPMVNDRYTACGHAGEYFLFFGNSSVYRTLLDRTATDEDGPIAYPRPEVIHGMPGTASPRSVVSLPGGRVAWWTPDNRLAIGTAGGFEYFEGQVGSQPISERYKDWFYDNVNPAMIQYAWAEYDPNRDWYMIHFIKESADAPVPPGTAYNTSIPTEDFYYTLVIDLRHSVVYTRSGDNNVSALRLPGESDGFGSVLLAGDQFGWLNDYLGTGADGAYYIQAGAPSAQTGIVYTLTNVAGAALTVTPTDLYNSNGKLADLYCLIERASAKGSWERARISSNTASVLTLTGAPSTTPAVGDKVFVAPINSEFLSRQWAFQYPTLVDSVLIDTFDPSGSTAMEMVWELYAALTRRLYALNDSGSIADTQYVTLETLEGRSGKVYFRRAPSRALMAKLRYIQREGSPVEIRRMMAFFTHQPMEMGRDLRW